MENKIVEILNKEFQKILNWKSCFIPKIGYPIPIFKLNISLSFMFVCISDPRYAISSLTRISQCLRLQENMPEALWIKCFTNYRLLKYGCIFIEMSQGVEDKKGCQSPELRPKEINIRDRKFYRMFLLPLKTTNPSFCFKNC